jgi:hypothetical protein
MQPLDSPILATIHAYSAHPELFEYDDERLKELQDAYLKYMGHFPLDDEDTTIGGQVKFALGRRAILEERVYFPLKAASRLTDSHIIHSFVRSFEAIFSVGNKISSGPEEILTLQCGAEAAHDEYLRLKALSPKDFATDMMATLNKRNSYSPVPTGSRRRLSCTRQTGLLEEASPKLLPPTN